MSILHPVPQNASIGRHSCQFKTPRYLAKTTGRDNPRRPWLMPRPFSIGVRKANHHVLAKDAFWWEVSRNWGGPWGLSPLLLITLFWKGPCLAWDPQKRRLHSPTLHQRSKPPQDPHSTGCSTAQWASCPSCSLWVSQLGGGSPVLPSNLCWACSHEPGWPKVVPPKLKLKPEKGSMSPEGGTVGWWPRRLKFSLIPRLPSTSMPDGGRPPSKRPTEDATAWFPRHYPVLIRDLPPWVTIKVPLELTLPSLLVGPTMTTLMSTRICQDEATGIMHMDTVTASMELVSFGTSLVAVNCQTPTLEVISNTNVADLHPK